MITHDVIIVGAGLAGLRAAVGLCEKYDVAIVSKVHPLRSHSIAAQGGINAALANHPEGSDDTWEKHMFDTVKGSDYLGDQDAIELLCKEAPGVVYEMEHWGCPFSRFPDGSIAQRPFGGAGFPRTCFSADLTGHVLLNTLFEKATAMGVKIYHEFHVAGLSISDGTCHGIVALDQIRGEIVPMAARAVLFATGGYGRVYFYSTNALINTGSGIGLAYHAGVPIKDMEFVQFHPTSLLGTNILMSEACRGEGAYLTNKDGERFMQRYVPKAMELAPRDITSRSIQTEIEQGRGLENEFGKYVNLDLRHLGMEKIQSRLPGIRRLCIDFSGVDPVFQPIPIMPCQHYSMGGIDTNERCETVVAGFYAAGECACVSVHGANRLGGNSLLETIVFGKVAARTIPEYLGTRPGRPDAEAVMATCREVEAKVKRLATEGTEKPFRVLDRLRKTMSEYIGIFRTKEELQAGVDRVAETSAQVGDVKISSGALHMNYELIGALELEHMAAVAHAIALGALVRQESRGAHFRRDFTKRDDGEWLKHTIATRKPDGSPELTFRDVKITRFQPMERTY